MKTNHQIILFSVLMFCIKYGVLNRLVRSDFFRSEIVTKDPTSRSDRSRVVIFLKITLKFDLKSIEFDLVIVCASRHFWN